MGILKYLPKHGMVKHDSTVASSTNLTTHAALNASVHGVGASGFEDKANKSAASGYVALDASKNAVVPGTTLILTSDGAESLYIKDANTGETPFLFYRAVANSWKQYVWWASAWTQNLNMAMKNIANGVAGLDGSALVALAQIPATLTGKDADTLDTYHASTFATAANLATHEAATTGIHGAGASTIATVANIATHAALTTGIHGVGASTVESVSGSQAKVDTHSALTIGAHGLGGKIIHSFSDFSQWVESISGTGNTNTANFILHVSSGATASSTAARLATIMSLMRSAVPYAGEDWANKIRIQAVIGMEDSVATSISYIYQGASFTGKGFGFKVENLTLKGITSDGAAITLTDLTTTITINSLYVVEAVLFPGSKVEFYVNGVLKGTSTTNLPSGDTGLGHRVWCYTTNGATATTQAMNIFHFLWEKVLV